MIPSRKSPAPARSGSVTTRASSCRSKNAESSVSAQPVPFFSRRNAPANPRLTPPNVEVGSRIFSEPDVHSLLVTPVIVGNHRTSSSQPYNYLTPQSRLRRFVWESPRRGSDPSGTAANARMRPQSAAGKRLESANPMAFGFGFNKQKVLSAAEKFVQQGKLQNAIAEYEKVLKNDEKDLTVNNTIGDLYARLGDSEKAIECFKKVGDAYAAQGFTVKGIAMYKKLTKLQPSVDSSLKLAELYTQQGLFNDARAQYLQVAEDFMKAGDLDQAVRLFQKVLEMDPENVPMRVKLAEVYVRLGKKKEAWEIFSAAAEALRARGSLASAEDILKRMLAIDPGHSQALLLRAKAALDSDDPKHAIEYLEKASDLD